MNYSEIIQSPTYSNINSNINSKLKSTSGTNIILDKGVNSYNKNMTKKYDKYDTMGFEKIQENIRYDGTGIDIINKGIDCEGKTDKVGNLFFSSDNINRIQRLIRKEIFDRTNGEFRIEEDQDESDILVSMRAVYAEHARYLPFQIIRQVKGLNRKLIEYIVPDMITNIKQQYGYIKEISEPIKPIPRPLNVTHAGRRTLPSPTTMWGF